MADFDLESTIEYPPQVMDERSTRILDTALLQYIARQLWEIKEFWASTIEEGQVQIELLTVDGNEAPKELSVDWFTTVIQNNGPDTVYIRVNTQTKREIQLVSGMELSLSYRTAAIKNIILRCDAGESASIQAIGTY